MTLSHVARWQIGEFWEWLGNTKTPMQRERGAFTAHKFGHGRTGSRKKEKWIRNSWRDKNHWINNVTAMPATNNYVVQKHWSHIEWRRDGTIKSRAHQVAYARAPRRQPLPSFCHSAVLRSFGLISLFVLLTCLLFEIWCLRIRPSTIETKTLWPGCPCSLCGAMRKNVNEIFDWKFIGQHINMAECVCVRLSIHSHVECWEFAMWRMRAVQFISCTERNGECQPFGSHQIIYNNLF